jgi:AcrR family transcriptional regulator
MSPRPDVSEERRSQILEAALKVFARLGLDKARMDDIVSESGLSKGAIYWYFKSKDEIIAAILDSLFNREMQELETLNAREGPVYERLLAFIA